MDNQQALNIKRHQRSDELGSNYKLQQAPIKLGAKMLVGCRPDGDGWEEVWKETTTEEIHKSRQRIKPSKKQIAARRLMVESRKKDVQVVKLNHEVTMARLEGKPDSDIKVMEMVQEIRDLWKIADPKLKHRPERLLEEERQKLIEKFEKRRTK